MSNNENKLTKWIVGPLRRASLSKRVLKKLCRSLLEGNLKKLDSDHLSCCYGIWLGFQSCTQICSQFTATVRVAWPSNPSIKNLGKYAIVHAGVSSSSIDVGVPP